MYLLNIFKACKEKTFLKQKIQMFFSYHKTKTQSCLASSVHSFSFQMHFFLSSCSDKKLCKNPYCAIESQNFLSLSESAAFMQPTIIPACTCYLLLSYSWLSSWSASIQMFNPSVREWCLLTSSQLLNRLLGYGCLVNNFGYSL